MAGYAFNWGDADITDALTNVKCSGMISEAGGDGYGGTNWCFGVVGGAGQQWHVHFNAGGNNMLKYLDTGRGYPAERTNLKGLITSCASDYPQHVKLLTALQQALNTFVAA